MRLSIFACLVAALGVTSSAVRLPVLAKRDTPPSQDPFYKAPAGFMSKSPGTILRHRKVPNTLLVGPTFNPGDVKEAYQILYRTTSGIDLPSTAVTTLIIPHNADRGKLLSYQTFEDSPSIDCSPSYTLQKGQKNTNDEGVTISSALREGWYVTVPDYEGLIAAFTVGHQAGHATLDAIRAVLLSQAFSDISSTAKTALIGYSGGALASEWAMELQPSYAPELKVVGAAFGGLTPNVTSVIITINNTPNSNLIPKGILGFANQYKNVSDYLHRSLKPSKAAEFMLPYTNCNAEKLASQDIFSFFKQGRASLQAPIMKQVVAQNGIMGKTNTPTVPLYIFKSTGDEVSPVADTDALVKKYCDNGATIRYVRNHFGDHETEFVVGLPEAYRWVKDRLNGEPATKGCSTRNEKKTKLPPGAARILGKTVYEELKEELKELEG